MALIAALNEVAAKGVSSTSRPRPFLRLRGRSFMAVVLTPEPPLAGWMLQLDGQLSRSPRFFDGRPVVVDLAAEAGGNCAATVPGQMTTTANGVKVLGYRNWPSRIPVAASTLYARNLLTFLVAFWDKEGKKPALPETDDIIQGVMLTRGGQVVHPQFQPAHAA